MSFTEADLDLFEGKMKQAVRITKRLGVEVGFNVCKHGDMLAPTELCKGDKCSVSVPRCEWPDTFMEFHTHPQGSIIIPSPQDLYGSIGNDTDFVCMGMATRGGGIRCYKIDKSDAKIPQRREFIERFRKSTVSPSGENTIRMLNLMDELLPISKPIKSWEGFLYKRTK